MPINHISLKSIIQLQNKYHMFQKLSSYVLELCPLSEILYDQSSFSPKKISSIRNFCQLWSYHLPISTMQYAKIQIQRFKDSKFILQIIQNI